jgi:hypothetical protein
MLAFEHNVDIQVCEVRHDYVDYWMQKVNNKELTVEQVQEMSNFYSNVIESVKILIQVHKPFRINRLGE